METGENITVGEYFGIKRKRKTIVLTVEFICDAVNMHTYRDFYPEPDDCLEDFISHTMYELEEYIVQYYDNNPKCAFEENPIKYDEGLYYARSCGFIAFMVGKKDYRIDNWCIECVSD